VLSASSRRFKEALEQPFWSTLEGDLADRLWRALGRPGAPHPCVSKECNRASVAQKHGAGVGTPPALFTRLNRVNIAPIQALSDACGQHPVPAAGTPAGSSAQRWLSAQVGAVKCIESLDVGQKRDADWPAPDLDAGRLSALLASLPALTSIYLTLRPDRHCRPPAAAVRAFLAEAAHAIGRRSGLQTLHLSIILLGGLADQVPGGAGAGAGQCAYSGKGHPVLDSLSEGRQV